MNPVDPVVITARPEAFTLAPSRAAVIVVDMQNDFGSPGGMFDRAGIPIGGIQAVVGPIRDLLGVARAAGMLVVYLTMQFEADLSDAGGEAAPNLLKHRPLGIGEVVPTPDGTGRILVRDTWNTAIVADLTPEEGDLVVPKHRYSGFFGTSLDATLRDRGIDTLVVTGCTTSICVESTVRDACFRDYRCLVLEDCTAEPLGGRFARTNHEASLLSIEMLLGWVSDVAAFTAALNGTARTG